MDEIKSENKLPEITGCKNCAQPEIEADYEFPLCKNCRDTLSKKPLPFWIKGFFALIIVVLIYALFNFPTRVQAAVFFERGLKAEHSHRYLSAISYYQKVNQIFSGSALVLTRLGISYFQSEQIQKAIETLNMLAGRKPSDQGLVAEVNGVFQKIESLYLPDKELNELLTTAEKPERLIERLKVYIGKKPTDAVALYYLANSLFDLQKFDEVVPLCQKILARHPGFDPGNSLLAAAYREKREYEKALSCCRKMLQRNSENPNAYVSMARIELKRHRDQKGLQYARKAFGFDSESSYTIANLALAYHYNNQIKERDQTYELLKKAKDNTGEFPKLTAIINGDLKWRD